MKLPIYYTFHPSTNDVNHTVENLIIYESLDK